MTQTHEKGVFIVHKGVTTTWLATRHDAAVHRMAAEAATFIDTIRDDTSDTVNDTLRTLASLQSDDPIRQRATRLLQNVSPYEDGAPTIYEDLYVVRLPYYDGNNSIVAIYDYEVGRVTKMDCVADGEALSVLFLSSIDFTGEAGAKDDFGQGWHYRLDPNDETVIVARNASGVSHLFHTVGLQRVKRFNMQLQQRASEPVEVRLWVAPEGLSGL